MPIVQSAQQKVAIDEILTIEAEHWFKDLNDGRTIFEGDVRATYGQTVLIASRVVLDESRGILISEGASRLEDPEATLGATGITIDWKTGAGIATDATVVAGYVVVRGSTIEIVRDPIAMWRIEDAAIELSDLASSGNRLKARTVTVYPGKRVVAQHATIQLFGQNIGPISSQTFNLDQRVTGFRLPTVRVKGTNGLGVSWGSSFLLSESLSASGSWTSFPGESPGYRTEITKSFVAPDRQAFEVKPRGDLGERFATGWFGNITIGNPEEEFERLRDPRSSVSLGTVWNTSATARPVEANEVSKMVDLVFEQGGPAGDGAWVLTARGQRVRDRQGASWLNRTIVDAGFMTRPIAVGNFTLQSRFDLIGMASPHGNFGVARVEFGGYSKLSDAVRAGLAYVYQEQRGSADFEYDALLYSGSAAHLRLDYERGPYTLSVLSRYDFSGKRWFGTEWEFALAAGSLEPYVSRRELSGDVRFGVRLRIDRVVDRLQNRAVNR